MKFNHFVATISCLCLGRAYGMTQTPWLFEEDVTPVAIGMFPISRDAIISEIKQRTTEENVRGSVIRDELLKWAENITEPKVEIYIHFGDTTSENGSDAIPHLENTVMMLVPGNGMSLGLAYIPISESTTGNQVADGILSDQTVTVTNGDDRLTIAFDWKRSCSPSSKGIDPYNSGKLLHSWYPKKVEDYDDEQCTKAVRTPVRNYFCEMMESHRCDLENVQGDFCFMMAYEGNVCKVNTKVTEMTGVFRERSLITKDTPIKSIEGYYFEGINKLGLAYPCIYDD